MRIRALLLITATLLGATLDVRPAAAADASSEAEALIARGVDLREAGRDEEALAAFREAYGKVATPRARAQIALAEQALGMWVAAEGDLLAVLASSSDPWIARNRKALEGALAVVRKRLATIEVRGAEQADVYVDGARVGAGAGPYRVVAGRRSIEVRAEGYVPATRQVDLEPGGVARETVVLVRAPVPAAPPATPAAFHETRPPAAPSPAPAAEPPSTQRTLGWALLGTGAALLATGGVSMLVRDGFRRDYNSEFDAGRCPGADSPTQPSSCQALLNDAQPWLTVALVSFITGGVVAVSGGIVLATAPSRATPDAPKPAAASVACAPGVSRYSAFLTCAARF